MNHYMFSRWLGPTALAVVLVVIASATAQADGDVGIRAPARIARRTIADRSQTHHLGLSTRTDDEKRIEVNLSTQSLIAWQGERKVYEFPVTTGQEGQPTLIGDYEILDKEEDAYSDAWLLRLPLWMGIYQFGDYENGIHSLPIDNSGNLLWAEGLGVEPLSHGCVVLAPDDAETLFRWAEVGTTVQIHD
ncbi:MAG: L,D-transpeptidase [Chloroflexi bacterium]|nr:L,D-transpeptidase [Chloroflexota bacterium]MBI3732434.1 L,D-transpeptidase [Chloroflexota bacterium]